MILKQKNSIKKFHQKNNSKLNFKTNSEKKTACAARLRKDDFCRHTHRHFTIIYIYHHHHHHHHQVSGSSFLLWVSENYKDFKRLADEITAKEVRPLCDYVCIHFFCSFVNFAEQNKTDEGDKTIVFTI